MLCCAVLCYGGEGTHEKAPGPVMGQRGRGTERDRRLCARTFIVVFMWKSGWSRINRLRIAPLGQFQWVWGIGTVPGCLGPWWCLGQMNGGPESESHRGVGWVMGSASAGLCLRSMLAFVLSTISGTGSHWEGRSSGGARLELKLQNAERKRPG